ncbi:MAG: hypothetical protein NC121_10115 [Blautia sp.]|nr:hypothetical protein [Blautia sp.]
MDKKKKIRIQNLLFFLSLLLIYLIITLYLFHCQATTDDELFPADIWVYMAKMEGQFSKHDFPYPILFQTGKFFLLFTSPEFAIALAAALLNGLTPLALKYYFDRFLQVRNTDTVKRGVFSTLLVFSLLFASMLYPLTWLGAPPQSFTDEQPYRYIGTFTPNPYHNATYLAARPFSIPAIFLFADILTFYEKEDRWNHPKYICFSLFLCLATLAKPSFTLVFVSMAGIIMLWRLLTSHFQKVKAFFQMGIWFIPTFLVLLYQFGNVYQTNNDSDSIGFGFLTVWSLITKSVSMSILLGIAFPLTVLLFGLIQRQISGLLKFSWQFYLMALLTMAFLYEEGPRLGHVNFAWGYMYGLFFAYTISLIILAKNTLQRGQPVWQLGIQWTVYGLHLICGIDYFRVLIQGGPYH